MYLYKYTCKLHVQNDNDVIGTIDSTECQFENTPDNFSWGKNIKQIINPKNFG